MPLRPPARLLTALALALFMLVNAVTVVSEPARAALNEHDAQYALLHPDEASAHADHATCGDDCHQHHCCHQHSPLTTPLRGLLLSSIPHGHHWRTQFIATHDSLPSQPPVPPPDHARLS
ncbi:hypothetical protein A167_02062 [Alcanivorax sp. S71-1-4]|uniref:hypothetical protein n=1 Tax=Alcanivorax sp. S71-1-4 TaxID=1177159 RepID=UPI00135B3F90|nr:hypothetical protein [Alcanivorax sp. S71-1-4]KAF0809148.1 hypothetical protein A167_02062 [Alcanivorax sp. S71-1-4]